jgi:septal ring factor EnvC (AmiA/AmiB activator)
MLRAQGSQSDGQSVRCPGCGNQVALAAARMHALTCAALLSDVELSVDGVLSFRTLPSPDVEAIGDAEVDRRRLDAAEHAAERLERRVETLRRELNSLTYERQAAQATLQSAGRELECLRRLARELQREIDERRVTQLDVPGAPFR